MVLHFRIVNVNPIPAMREKVDYGRAKKSKVICIHQVFQTGLQPIHWDRNFQFVGRATRKALLQSRQFKKKKTFLKRKVLIDQSVTLKRLKARRQQSLRIVETHWQNLGIELNHFNVATMFPRNHNPLCIGKYLFIQQYGSRIATTYING